MKQINQASLFSGIGGFDLAAERAGWNNVFNCEIDEFCQKILKYYWKNAINYGDITKTDFTIWRGRIDVLTGGFPCQPFSLSGKRKGTDDERYLWKEMLRAIREIQPQWVIGENVLGLINWGGGLVFEQVQIDLENEGYEVTSYILPACGVNAPHKRERIWFVAKNTNKNGRRSNEWQKESSTGKFGNISTRNNERIQSNNEQTRINPNCSNTGIENLQSRENTVHESRFTANTTSEQSERLQFRQREFGKQKQRKFRGSTGEMGNGIITNSNSFGLRKEINGPGASRQLNKTYEGINWENFPTQSPICSGNDGIPNGLDGITFSKWRQESIKSYGNAIVPQVVFEIFKVINIYYENGI